MEEKQLFPDRSFGFRSKHSTEDCLNYATNHIMEGKRKNLVTIGIFFDFSNAFNKVDVDTLSKMMSKMNVQEDIQTWITNFLNNRKLVVHTEQGKSISIVSQGLPQGDVL